MHSYLIVGKSFSGLKNKIVERGDDYFLLQDKLATRYPNKQLKHRVVADFSSKDSVINAVKNLPVKVDAVVTVYENYVLASAWISEYLNVPGLPLDAAEACTDKFLMRTLFAKSLHRISPDFAIIESAGDLEAFAKSHDYPIILKPANLAKSLLVTKNDTLSELKANYQKAVGAIEEIYKTYAPHRQPKLIAEEFMEGSIHSVDAFVDADGQPYVLKEVVDYQTGYDIGYNDNFHYSRILPSKLSDVDTAAIRDIASIGCRALGMKNSPAHVEIILTKTGPMIVEIGARNGGYRERMHRLANNIDIPGVALDIAIGKRPVINQTKNESCAVLELFPKEPGIFIGIKNEPALKKLQSLDYFAIKQPIGSFVGKSSDGYKMCAVIILHHTDKIQFEKDLAFVNTHVTVNTTRQVDS